ncbi:MAG: FkbM family methyltransferase [Prosthecobacter sp.]|jgi:FkbM family methyltransferase|nr:FkbM family methyltransferase [Prosthecobacter sp.]
MLRRLLIYGREILVSLPLHLIKGWRHFGWRGAWLAWCDLVFTALPFPIHIPGFGPLLRRNEARSLMDNFCLGELRCAEVEQALRDHPAPTVIDLGVNLGMSIRWWFHLNPKARVTGVEMMQESLDYTTQRLGLCHPEADWQPICCAVAAADGEPMEIQFSDPLEGTTSAARPSGQQRRQVPVRCLDSLLDEPEILLLKCDIEGFGGQALLGAREVLKRTRYVVTETHGPEETALMSQVLFEVGFTLFQLSSRSLWWHRRGA